MQGLVAMVALLPCLPRVGYATTEVHDPYLWLEDSGSRRVSEWTRIENQKATALLKSATHYEADYQTILARSDASDRIPYGNLNNNYVYNFWQDPTHVRGVWRRAAIAGYATPEPAWQILIDLDKMDEQEHTKWVWGGAECAPQADRCLVQLSPGGGDAFETREFDLQSRTFVKDGFSLPTAKSLAGWVDRDTILFSTNFGPGSMTNASYPRIVKIWRRGQSVTAAKTIYRGDKLDLWAQAVISSGAYGRVPLIVHQMTFFTAEFYYLLPSDKVVKLPLPLDAQVHGVTDGQLIITLRKDWVTAGMTFPQGSLLAFRVLDFIRTRTELRPQVLFTPDSHTMIDHVAAGGAAVYASIYRDVTGSVHAFYRQKNGTWVDQALTLPQGGSTRIVSADPHGRDALISFENFITPPTLYLETGEGGPLAIKSLPAKFDANELSTEQAWAISTDGTKIPYFVVGPRHATGPRPTILNGYGGFQIALTPSYLADIGKIWLNNGGTYVLANIRGGGEFGPAWHEAAMKLNRQKAFDDFAAVAKDIESRGITTPRQLGIIGGSNGGLLVSTVMTQHPELLGAVICQVPLIDMLRYTRFGAGASWQAEYGDPADPSMRAAIAKYSPYQNVRADQRYPPILFVTSTNDDRVTPVHARKMAAKMQAQAHDVLFYESAEGGHEAGATHAEAAEMWALSFAFLGQKLGLGK